MTTNEIMEFLQEHMVMKGEFESRMGGLETRVGGLETRVGGLETRVGGLETRVGGLEVKINQVKLDLLDAMDEKLGRLKGDLVVMMRNEDKKVMLMVRKLKEKNIFDDNDVEEFLKLLPFPQMV
ncbi:hypothetical protein HY733_02405 [Candidatus Uhrbacteria bacterium]|nr:hypothetical protein [Candidatus Uhrbacteria bacterium]